MKRPRKIAALTASLMVVASLSVAAAASATSPEACVPDPGQPYIEATYATEYEFERTVIDQEFVPGVPEVTENVWIYKKWVGGHNGWWIYKEFPQTAKPSDPGQGWIFWKKEVRVIEEAIPEIPEVSHVETTWSEETSLDGWTATGNTRSGEGVTRVIDPGQPYIAPTLCPGVNFTDSNKCGEASVTVTAVDIPATWWYGAKIAVDGVEVDSVITQGPGSDTATLVFDEDQGNGEVTVRYWVHASTEWDLVPVDLNYQSTWPDVTAYREFTVDTDCEDPEMLVATAGYKILPPACIDGKPVGETFVLIEPEHASYSSNTTASGTTGPGTWMIEATADEGYTFGNVDWFYGEGELAGPDASLCEVDPPVVIPPTTPATPATPAPAQPTFTG